MGTRLTSAILAFLVAGLALASPAGAALVGWWQLDDGAGTTAVDSSGNGFDGVLEGDPAWVNGAFGGALQLDGGGDAVRIPAMDLDTSAGATMTAWIRPAASQTDWCGVIFSRIGGEAGIWITNANGLLYSWSGADAWNFNPGFTASADEWSFVAVVVTPTSGTLYLNDESAVWEANHSAFGFTGDTFLGWDPQNNNSNKFYTGALDDCRIYDHPLTPEELGVVRKPEPPTQAVKPFPVNGAVDAPRDVVLSWEPGPYAATHNVYFGTSLDDVNNASLTNPLGVLAAAGQESNTYDPPGSLELGQTYYWRIDEVNAAPDDTTFKGNIWSFQVEPLTYPVTDITATASTTGGDLNNAINGSGLNADGTHVTAETEMWLGDAVEGEPVWVQYDFDRDYKLSEAHIWNYNGPYEFFLGFGFQDVTIEYATDADNWTALGDFQLSRAPGSAVYAGQTIDFGGVAASSVRISVQSNWGTQQRYGLSEIRFYYIPAHARQPQPASGVTGVSLDPVLRWRAGREAAAHDVSLDPDQQAVAGGTAAVDTTTDASYAASSLDLGTTYYWKVDEVNETEAITTWLGDVWDFTTQQCIVVDDFESYTDDAGNEIFATWIDGYNINDNGSRVGYLDPPYAEEGLARSGQSMPLFYINDLTASVSVAERTFDGPQDWTRGAATTLVLHFLGIPDNNADEPMWVRLTDQSNHSGTVTYGTRAGESTDNQTIAAWHEWSIPLAEFGVDATGIKAMAIGFGGTGPRSSGVILFDDICLYPSRPESTPVLAAHWALDGNADDGSGNGNHGTVNGGATWVGAGRIGGALSLNGTDAYVDGGNGASLGITEAITLSAWVNTADANNAEHNPFVTKGDQAYALKHNTSNQIECFIYDETWYTATFPIDDSFNGEWHHVASSYDGLHLRLYIDGALRATLEHAGSIASTTYNVNIGRNAQNTSRLYNGLIDEVRVYDGALPPAEIVQLATP